MSAREEACMAAVQYRTLAREFDIQGRKYDAATARGLAAFAALQALRAIGFRVIVGGRS